MTTDKQSRADEWALFGDLLAARAKELKHERPDSLSFAQVAIVMMGIAGVAERVSLAILKDEVPSAARKDRQ